jgi:hypothetical protein
LDKHAYQAEYLSPSLTPIIPLEAAPTQVKFLAVLTEVNREYFMSLSAADITGITIFSAIKL